MARSIISVLLLALFALPLKAQHPESLPDSPHPKSDRHLAQHILLTAAGETFIMLDAHSTRQLAAIPGWREGNPVVRPFVHSDGLYAEQTAEEAGLAWLGWRMHRATNRWIRRFWWLPQSAQMAMNIQAWRGNVRWNHQHTCWVQRGSLSCFQ